MTANTLTESVFSAKSHKDLQPSVCCIYLRRFHFLKRKMFHRQQVYIVNQSGCVSWPKHSMYCYVQGHLMTPQNNSDTRGLTLSISNEELDSWDFSSLCCWFSEGESESFLSLLYQREAGWTVQWCHSDAIDSYTGEKNSKVQCGKQGFLINIYLKKIKIKIFTSSFNAVLILWNDRLELSN